MEKIRCHSIRFSTWVSFWNQNVSDFGTLWILDFWMRGAYSSSPLQGILYHSYTAGSGSCGHGVWAVLQRVLYHPFVHHWLVWLRTLSSLKSCLWGSGSRELALRFQHEPEAWGFSHLSSQAGQQRQLEPGSQSARGKSFFLSLLFCLGLPSIHESHPHKGGQSVFFWTPIKMSILSRNTLKTYARTVSDQISRHFMVQSN